MKLDVFNNLTEEEKTAFLSSADSLEKQIDDLTAERNSLKIENESLNNEIAETKKELKATKEVNFTLARKIPGKPKSDPETLLHNFMKGI